MDSRPELPNGFLHGTRIAPKGIRPGMAVADLVDQAFLAYNAARLAEAARLLTRKMLRPDVTLGLTLTGALTPAGLGCSCLVPLIQAGCIDWIVSTGANLYPDTHFALDLELRRGSPFLSDRELRDHGVIRIYDVLFDYRVLLDTDAFFRELIKAPAFQRSMSTAEFHHLVGAALCRREQALSLDPGACMHAPGDAGTPSVLAAAYQAGVPVFTSSPGDSSIGMNVAAMALEGNCLAFDVNADVNESTSIVLDAKCKGGKSAVWVLGGGSPKNFILQTEPQIQEVLGIDERGHDYFLQITDARPDTGGLSGATPSEAVSWGKIDPDQLPDTVVCYTDSTIALPLLTAYILERTAPREPKRLFDRRVELMDQLKEQYATRGRLSGAPTTRRDHPGPGTWPCGAPKVT
jgi:deoxyhypusine synthase